ncbi:MAG: response regulator [Candidatus Methylomirabilales bacterium]
MPKVLVVDDSLSVRKVVERALAAQGLAVLSAASAGEAEERIEREAPDLVVCDVILPDRDGFDVCRFVKAHPRARHTPVLMMSGVVNPRTMEQAAAARSDDLLRKPFAADELVSKTRSLLGLSAPPAPAPAPPAPAAPVAGAAAPPEAAPAPQPVPMAMPAAPAGLSASLAQLVATPGVGQALLVDREGFLIASTADDRDGDVVSALASCLRELFDGLPQDLGQGRLRRVILENERGIVVFQIVKRSVVLVVILTDPTALGKVRYDVKRVLPALIQAL